MSIFNLSNTHVYSGDMGQMIPVRVQEVLPGDKIVGKTSAVIRMMPQLAPFFTRVVATVITVFTPNRLVWDEWEDFITGGPTNDPIDEPEWPHFVLPTASPGVGELLDYMGVPPGMGTGEPGVKKISAIPVRAVWLTWNEWGRDQDLQTVVPISTASGQDTTTDFQTVPRLSWMKDYFTVARPDPQKGPAITISLGTTAPVNFPNNPNSVDITTGPNQGEFPLRGTSDAINGGEISLEDTVGPAFTREDAQIHMQPGVADLSAATAIEINALRRALAYQRFSENRARYGSRYSEYLRALGVISPDERLQRPEICSLSKQVLMTSEVLQTAQTTADPDGVGEMFGHTLGIAKSNSFKRYFPEHGTLITYICVRPDPLYSQGLNCMWNREHKEDYFQTELQHIGSQPIYRRELNALGNAASDATIYGYKDPYDDLRFMPSYVTGEFRPGQDLDHWTLAREFATPADAVLNSALVECLPSKRIFPVTNKPVLWVKVRNKYTAKRLLIPVGTSLTL